jgi:hypothetical protein
MVMECVLIVYNEDLTEFIFDSGLKMFIDNDGNLTEGESYEKSN